MRTVRAVIAFLACFALVAGGGLARRRESQGENQAEKQQEKQAAKQAQKQENTQEKSAAPKKAEAKKQTVQVSVTAEGKTELPSDSRIVLSGKDGCENLENREISLRAEGKVSFPDIPICTVSFRIIIPGFETKFVRVDLAKHKTPIRIQVKASGPPLVE